MPRISPQFRERPQLLLGALFLLLLSQNAGAAEADFSAAVGRGPLYAAGLAFVGGVLVSLTPCVYPMIAITVSVFGAKQTRSRLHGLALSSAFVAGIVAMFTPLGVLAGMTGSLFGSVLQSPWVLCMIALLFLTMAASMLGAFELALPASLTNRLAQVGGIGMKGAFGLGLVCGLIAAPCTGPVLTGILTWIAETQSAFAGAAAMAAFSLGLGLPFFFVGAFAVQLPKSGPWMVHIKSILAMLLIVVALYYLSTAFSPLASWIQPHFITFVAATVIAGAGVLLGSVHRDYHSPQVADKALKTAGILLTCGGSYVLLMALLTPERSLNWSRAPLAMEQERAQANNQPLLVDFTAAWCGACKELDKITFADPVVSREAGRFVAVKVDATDDEDPVVASTMQSLKVVGLPTVVLFDSQGNEVKRFTDFVGAEPFASALRKVD